jgi:hypothetical protein
MAGVACQAGQASGGLDPVQPWHAHVHQHHVGPQPAGQLDRLDAVDGLADHLDVGLGLKDEAKAAPDQGLVVGDEHPDPSHAGHVAPASVGSRARTA